MPILGTGVAGFSFEEGARIVAETVRAHEPTTLSDVRLIAYDEAQYRTLEEVAADATG